jgi:hypothetical protein
VEFVLFFRGQGGKIFSHGQPFAFLCGADGLPLGLECTNASCSEGLSSAQWGRDWVPVVDETADSAFTLLPDEAELAAGACAHVPIAQAHITAAIMGLITCCKW